MAGFLIFVLTRRAYAITNGSTYTYPRCKNFIHVQSTHGAKRERERVRRRDEVHACIVFLSPIFSTERITLSISN